MISLGNQAAPRFDPCGAQQVAIFQIPFACGTRSGHQEKENILQGPEGLPSKEVPTRIYKVGGGGGGASFVV
jgi:hypothetical protein